MNHRLVETPIPDDDRPGVPDPRVLQLWLDAQARAASAPPAPPKTPRTLAEEMADLRASMGWPNLDLAPSVAVADRQVAGPAGPVPVMVYTPAGKAPAAGRPAVVYFHGGGFVGGSLKTVENPCKLLAARSGSTVVSVDYRLAPEAPFPGGLEDCWAVVKALADEPESWGVDPRRIAVAGDSAGGNLAAACCVTDALEARPGQPRRVAAQLLIYPVVDLRPEGEGHLPWSLEAYDIQAYPEFVTPSVLGLKNAGPFFNAHYLQGADPAQPRVSPLTFDPAQFPPTLVITAEYDFLRVEGEEFARRLAEAGVETRTVRYRGVDHAFFDKLGLFPQAALAVAEMAAFWNRSGTWRTAADLAGPSVSADLAARLGFLAEADRLKLVVRRNELSDASRRENTAEHSWHLVLFALTLADAAAPGTDVAHAVKLCAVHDLVEIDAGDTFFWDEAGYTDKEARERAAARRLFGLLPPAQGAEFLGWWEEFEACTTPEALFANAVDRLAPVLLNSRNGGRSWRDHGITADRVRQKMTVVAQASPALGRVLEALIERSVDRGVLGAGPAPNP